MAYFIGFLLATITALGARHFGLDRDRVFYPFVLSIVATYDVVFAMADGRAGVLLFEVAVLSLLLTVAVIGFRTSLWLVVAGLAAHGMLDSLHGLVLSNRGIPAWWPAFCATYDIAIAGMLAVVLLTRTRTATASPSKLPASGYPGILGLVVLLLTASAGAASAQGVRPAVSLSFVQAHPLGTLGANIGNGYGAVGTLLLPLTPNGALSFRADVGAAEYGNDSHRSQFSESVGGRVEVKVRTSNVIVPASLGLQLTLRAGPLLPYLTTGVGAQAFYTQSSVEPTSGGQTIASTINQSDVAFAWTVGGGTYVRLGQRVSRVLLDLGVQYSHGGSAEYLAKDGIVDLPGGQIRIAPMASSTHLLLVKVGARIGL